MVPWTHMSQPTNGISIGSAVSAQITRVSNTQTEPSVDAGELPAENFAISSRTKWNPIHALVYRILTTLRHPEVK